MRIGEIAKRTGLKISNIRFYERKGLLTPKREQDSQYRDYTEELQRPSVGMIVAMLILNGMFICVIPSGIGLYYFMSGLFQAAEQFVYYQGCVHRLQSAE